MSKNAFTPDGAPHRTNRVLDVSNGLKRIGEFEAAEMLTNYIALLRERESAKTKSDPVAWRYRLDGDMQWQHTSDKRICMGEIEPLYAVAPMLASVWVLGGWQLVPVEPTDEMIEKGTDQHKCVQGDSWYTDQPLSENDCIAIYKAMLAAAGEPNHDT